MSELTASDLSGLHSGMSAVGSGVAGFNQYRQGQAQKAAYEYNANVGTEKMKEEAGSSELQFSRLMSRQRSLYAKAGVDISSGSPLLVLAESAMQADEEQKRIKESGDSQATMNRFAGDMASFTGTTAGMTTFLTELGKSGLQNRMSNKGISSPWLS